MMYINFVQNNVLEWHSKRGGGRRREEEEKRGQIRIGG